MRTTGLIILLFSLVMSASAQQLSSAFKSRIDLANQHYLDGEYAEAIEIYEYLVYHSKETPTTYLRLGRMYYELRNWDKVIRYLEKYKLEHTFPPEDHLRFAQALAAAGQYIRAAEEFSSYADQYGGNDWLTLKIWRLSNLDYLYEDSLSFSIQPLRQNSEVSDVPVAYFQERLLFISNRDRPVRLSEAIDASTNHAPYTLYETSSSRAGSPSDAKLSPLLPVGDYHIGGFTSVYGNENIIYAKNQGSRKDKGRRLSLYTRNTVSGVERALDFVGEKSSFMHPSLSSDGTTLYFSANLPDGAGGYDLYKSTWDGTSWSKPENLGSAVNTPGDEKFPFIHASGMLYFSSNGLPGFGGLDLFKINLTSDDEALNLGYPMNSSTDDFALILNERGDFGHFASNRNKGGLDDDIFSVDIDLQEYPLTIRGVLKLKNLDREPVILPETIFEVVDNESQEVVYTAKSNKEGYFAIEIPFASQFYIRIKMGTSDPLVVSLEIPKNKDKQANHEIVVVSNRYIPIENNNE